MAISFDGVNKRINLEIGTTSLSVRDLWSRAVDWWLTEDNSKFIFPLTQVGGDSIDAAAGTMIPIYCFLMSGWKVKPQEANHTLSVGDGILLVDGGGDPFVATTGAFTVRINYQQPVQAISFASSGGGTAIIDYQQVTEAIWNAPISSYVSGGSFGKMLQDQGTNIMKVLGLVHQNIQIDRTVYDAQGNLISSRIRIWENAEDVGTEESPLASYEIECTTTAAGRFSSWKQTETR